MTGYVPITASFTEIPETSQLIPWEEITTGIYYELPSGKDSPCVPYDIVYLFEVTSKSQLFTCNSTCITHYWNETDRNVETGKITHSLNMNAIFTLAKSSNCGDIVNMTIDGMTYTYFDLWKNEVPSYCFNNTPYDDDTLFSNRRCLPKTTQRGSRAGYQWGFSAMLTSTVLIVHAVWATSLYAIWLDAELGSTLVKQGFRLTQLRGAYFAVAAMKSSSSSSAANMPEL
ncbi:hypothetical protein UCDDS831_g06103 [Diplodia seriata]|uniref:Uncharacterized protein n=1 Tax=Diplodia seriata TaxID=420778 RepID=A0A0G2E7J2_9PEZI|nr:hypothetical protein UCDDS831_g06103 [Diplodia seriata]